MPELESLNIAGTSYPLYGHHSYVSKTDSGMIAHYTAPGVLPFKNIIVNITPTQAGSGDPSSSNIRTIRSYTGCTIGQSHYNLLDQDAILNASGWVRSSDEGFTTYGGVQVYKGSLNGLQNTFDTFSHRIKIPAIPGKKYRFRGFWRSVSANSKTGLKFRIWYTDGSHTDTSTSTANQTWTRISIASDINKVPAGLGFTYNNNMNIYLAGLMCMDEDEYQALGDSNFVCPGDMVPATVTWESEVGKVYSGTLNPLTGELRVRPSYESYNGETLVGPWISDRDAYDAGTTPTIGAKVVDFGGEEKVYNLPSLSINAHPDLDKIWADCGEISITYGAYIEACAESFANAITAASEKLGNFNVKKYTYLNFAAIVGGLKSNIGDNVSLVDGATSKVRFSRIMVCPGDIIVYSPIYDTNGIMFTCRAIEYDDNDIVIDSYVLTTGGYHTVNPKAKCVRFNFGYADSLGIDATPEIFQYFQVSAIHNTLTMIASHQCDSYGKANVMARANQMHTIIYKPVATLPQQNGDQPAGEAVRGLPYSSVRALDKYIGINLSIYTFMSAMANPRSVLYTRRSTATNSKTYYGVVCSSFGCYALGLKAPYLNTNMLKNSPEFHKRSSPYGIQIGDLLIKFTDTGSIDEVSGHTAVITDIIKDAYGRILVVQITDSWQPNVRRQLVSFDNFLTEWINDQDYSAYYYDNVDCVDYEKLSFVRGYPDEIITEPEIPDIMSEYGDKACIEAGTDVVINVINARDYTSINIYKDNTLIETKSAIEDFTIQNITAGTYRFEITDGTNTSIGRLIAADVNGSYDEMTGVITYSSTNATPIAVAGYISAGGNRWMHKFTNAEKTAGTMNITSYKMVDVPYVRIYFETEYGTAVWYSNPLNLWSPVT